MSISKAGYHLPKSVTVFVINPFFYENASSKLKPGELYYDLIL